MEDISSNEDTVDAGAKIRRFYGMKTEWGFDQLIPLDIFKNESNGYLIEDNCAFGAEVFVTKYAGKGQCLSMIKESKENTYVRKIDNFSTTNESSLVPEEFEAGGRKWSQVDFRGLVVNQKLSTSVWAGQVQVGPGQTGIVSISVCLLRKKRE
ncbi:hypothetical protein LguiA_027312 [Lonicera macranthoides]